MKQKFSLSFFFLLALVSFLSVNRVSACTIGAECQLNNSTKGICGNTFIEGESVTTCLPGSPSSGSSTPTSGACYDEFGGTIPCTYNPATGTPLSGNASTGECSSGYTCSSSCNGTSSGTCDGGFGVCCRGGAVSPTPTPSGGTGTPSAGGGGAATGSNRPPASGPSGSAPAGLHIPTTAETGLSSQSVTNLITNLMKWLLYIVGFVAIIAFVISGIQYLLAAGSEEMAKKAKENMQYAIIGVIVALSGLIIIRAIQAVLLGAWIF